jgi:hypothetical protein
VQGLSGELWQFVAGKQPGQFYVGRDVLAFGSGQADGGEDVRQIAPGFLDLAFNVRNLGFGAFAPSPTSMIAECRERRPAGA